MLRVTVIGGHALKISFVVADNDPVGHGVEAVLLAQLGEQLHRCLIGAPRLGLCSGLVQYLKGAAAGVLDLRRLSHFHAHMGIVGVSSAVPAAIIPGEALIHSSVRLYHRMDSNFNAAPVPLPGEYLRAGLGASNAVQHQALWATLLKSGVPAVRFVHVVLVAGVIDAVVFNQLHCCCPPLRSAPARPAAFWGPAGDLPCTHFQPRFRPP